MSKSIHVKQKKVISLLLGMFAEVFAYQRGRIFGFGPNANDDTKNVLKISQNFPETEEA